LKLAVIGTHGVGKTTLTYELCSLLKKADYSVELVTETSLRSPFSGEERESVEAHLWLLHAQIAIELESASRAAHLICDRAVLDHYCYLASRFGRQPQLEQWLNWWMRGYSLLVLVPPMADGVPQDGFQSETLEFQQRIHELMEEMLSHTPFQRLNERVLRLDRRDRRVWSETVFAASVDLLRPARRVRVVGG